MATRKTNENCHYVQNDPHKCKIKLKNFILELLRKVSWGGGGGEESATPR